MKITTSHKADFTSKLMDWHLHINRRVMPWKGEPDPYKIWLSEIMLQQTRVEQGLSYYLRFTTAYPTIFDLAKAPDEEVFKNWEGLGYYARCRNLLFTARMIVNDFGGRFPADHSALLQLKGVGPYTAAAIASFGFGLAHAVVDGNVTRVLSRYFLIEKPLDSVEGKKIFKELAQDVLDKNAPGAFNQAIMDFGATVCKPITPDCSLCPMTSGCGAFKYNKTQLLPLKVAGIKRKSRYFAYHVLCFENDVWITERKGKDIWRHLFEFALDELATEQEWKEYNPLPYLKEAGLKKMEITEVPEVYEQLLTHQQIKTRFYMIRLSTLPEWGEVEGKWVEIENLRKYAFPGTITRFLENKFP